MGEPKPEEKKDEKSTPTNKKKKVEKNTGLTISSAPGTNTGATISTYDKDKDGKDIKDKSNIYEDPNTGSTIATKEARTNVAEGGSYQIKASTDAAQPKMTGVSQPGITNYGTVKTGQILYEKNKEPVTPVSQTGITHFKSVADAKKDFNIVQKQKKLISEPRPSEDLLTGAPLKYSGPGSTTAITKMNPQLRRNLLSLGTGLGNTLRRLSGLQPK